MMTTCIGCIDTTSLVTIRMRISGRNLAFQSCTMCESNTWRDDAGALSLAQVLAFARAHCHELSATPSKVRARRRRVDHTGVSGEEQTRVAAPAA
jgi:hypothetical protein